MKLTLIITLFLHLFGVSQNDTINQRVNGKKNGVWTVYLDSTLNTVKDSSTAYFIAYENYDLGDRIFKYYKHPYSKADSVVYSMEWPTKGKPKIISGVFRWYSSDGRILGYNEYKTGWPWFIKSYQYYKKDIQKCGFNEVLDWSKSYNGIFGTYYYEEYWDNKLHMHGWFRKGKRGWKVYKDK